MLEVFAGCDMVENFRRRISGMFFSARVEAAIRFPNV